MAEYAILAADQGTDTSFLIEVVDENKNPRNLTGFTVAAKFRKQFNSNVVYSFTATIADPASAGKIYLTLSGAFTNTITAGRYFYDVEIRNETLDVTERITEGFIELSPSVTQSATAYRASTGLVPTKLEDLIDVNDSGQANNEALVYKADSDIYVFKAIDDLITVLDSDAIPPIVLATADSDYVRTVFNAGNGIAISPTGEISVTQAAVIDRDQIIAIIESDTYTINGGSF
jgi:hypothetical protein